MSDPKLLDALRDLTSEVRWLRESLEPELRRTELVRDRKVQAKAFDAEARDIVRKLKIRHRNHL